MGQSTDAILAYGLTVGEEFDGESVDEAVRTMLDGDEVGGLTMVLHCMDGDNMWLLAASSSVTTAHRGSPQRIESLAASPDWNQRLLDFAKAHHIPVTGEPGWILCSWWG